MDDNTWEPPRPVPPPVDPTAPYPTAAPLPGPTGPTGSAVPGVPAGPTAHAEVEPPRRRSPITLVAAIVGVVALVGAGVFAVTRIAGGDDGGADTPEAAGQALLTAIEDEDALGVIDVLLPGERDTLRDPMVDLVAELRRVEVLNQDADLAAVGGIDVRIEDESIDVEETNVDDIVNLRVTAMASASVEGEALPIGDLLLDNDADPSELTTETTEPEELDLPLTAVRSDGRWYVSLAYTIAEQARQSMEDSPDIPSEGIAAVGADSPEDAMDNMIDSIEALDLEGMIGALNPEEFGALQRYAPLFIDDAQAELDDVDSPVTIDDPEYSVSGDGSTRRIGLDYLRMTIGGDDPGTVTLENGCWLVEAGGETIDTCQLGDDLTELEDLSDDPEVFRNLIEAFRSAFDDYENPGFIVEEVDGKWFLSPIATVAEQMLAVLRAIDREEIDELISAVEDAENAELEVDTDELVPIEDLLDDYSNPNDDATATTVPGGSTDDSVVDDPGESCFVEIDGEAAAECYQRLIDAGDIDPAEVAPYLRAPECGLADLYWSGDYYNLPDAEFVTIVEEAAPCFRDAVDSGQLSESDLPLELAAPECLEGRNWYTVDDQDYDETFIDCASN